MSVQIVCNFFFDVLAIFLFPHPYFLQGFPRRLVVHFSLSPFLVEITLLLHFRDAELVGCMVEI